MRIFQHFHSVMKPAFPLRTPKLCLERKLCLDKEALHTSSFDPRKFVGFHRILQHECSVLRFGDAGLEPASAVCQPRRPWSAAVGLSSLLWGLALCFEV